MPSLNKLANDRHERIEMTFHGFRKYQNVTHIVDLNFLGAGGNLMGKTCLLFFIKSNLIMKPYFRLMLFVLLVQLITGRSYAFDLPAPADLISNYKLSKRSIKVVEPHQTTQTQHSYVEYTAVPIDELLNQLFGEEWTSEDTQVIFFGKDGYRSAVSSTKLTEYQAYLAFARTDNKAFTVDNIEQNQKGIKLGPYYLIWANLGSQELITYGAYDWPYQVTKIELQGKNVKEKLRPHILSPDIEIGMQETEKYCLNCHSIRAIGGQKYPIDLIKATCRWQENDLKAWINAPSVIKPGTSMPALNRMLVSEERGHVIDRIVNYLQAMKTESSQLCPAK